MITRKQIEAAAERAGWNCKIRKEKDGYYVCFNTDSKFGQDVCFEYNVSTLEQIKDEVLETHMNYDPSEEAMLWVGEDGHGKNGAPDDIRDIITDMEDVESKLEDLYTVLNGGSVLNEHDNEYVEKAKALRNECLSELLSMWHKAIPSKFINDVKGFKNPLHCNRYEEIVNLYGKWILLDENGLQYDINCMELEEFCAMTDEILKTLKK